MSATLLQFVAEQQRKEIKTKNKKLAINKITEKCSGNSADTG